MVFHRLLANWNILTTRCCAGGFAKINNLGNTMNLENIEAVGEAMAISLDGWINKKNDNKIYIDGQLVGELKGLKFIIEVTSKTLDTDIKSIKKAARKGVEAELSKRVDEILDKKEITINNQSKITWKNHSIARLKKGHDYLNPEIEIPIVGSCVPSENPILLSVNDVENDQGRWVNLSFTRSYFDSVTLRQIEIYTVEANYGNGWISSAPTLAYSDDIYLTQYHTRAMHSRR